MKKLLALILAAIMLFCFSACDEEQVFRYDMKASPKNLDPQMAYDTVSQIVLSHVMQGLVKQNESGNIVCDAALDYTVSADGTLYTFTLQETLKWSDGSSVTADDFVFALRRIFFKETSTPNQSSFLCIKNAQEIVNGEKTADDLGVSAISDTILEIELTKANPRFLYALATTAAYPCKSEFFYSTKGKYGYNEGHLIFNGPYVISRRTDNYIQLAANPESTDYEKRKDTSIVLYTNASYDAQMRFLDGTTDFAQISRETAKSLDTSKFESFQFESATWVLGFNQNRTVFENLSLRKAMLSAIYDILPNTNGSPHYKTANGLIVPSIELDGKSYRELAGDLAVKYNEDIKELLDSALEELGRNKINKLTLLCPNDSIFKYYVTYIQKAWNEKLGIIVNFVSPSEEEYYNLLYSGDFDLAIFPIEATENSVLTQLNKLSSQSNYNYLYYVSEGYQALLDATANASSVEEIVSNALKTEKYLIEDAVLIPLVYEESYVATNKSAEKIKFSPFGPTVDFTDAYKK